LQIPYIKPLQKKLVRKHAKMYELLKFHRVFETEKYFGRSMQRGYDSPSTSSFYDYYFFTTDFIKDKYKQNLHRDVANFQSLQSYIHYLRDRPAV
jgi:hypothetical protein